MKFTLRIKSNRVLKYVLKKGTYKRGRYIAIHITNTKENKQKTTNFFGVCVSKKNGISVHRNKMKRWAREVYKQEESNIKKGYNIVVLYMKNTTLNILDYYKIKEDICSCLKDLNLYE